MTHPLAIDLFCGLGGWTEGLLAEGYKVIGFDIERHDYGDRMKYPAQLVLQDVLTLDGSQFKNATLIVASPPCQEYSYMAMPWTRAKAIAAEYRNGTRDVNKLTALFDACFRIQREACAAAGRHIPLIVENVRGAVPWVGPCQGKFGSFYLWGDVPPLLPIPGTVVIKQGIAHRPGGATNFHLAGQHAEGQKTEGHINRRDGYGHTRHLTNQAEHDEVRRFSWNENEELQAMRRENGCKGFTPNGEPLGQNIAARKHSSKLQARRRASALIAKIPLVLSRYIAAYYKENA